MLLVHVWLGGLNLFDGYHQPAGDVTGVYRFWVEHWWSGGVLVGLQTDWVYPIGALVPMLAAGAFGHDAYLAVWLVMVTALDVVATVALVRRRPALAWAWTAFLLLLGPVALSRLDSLVAPIAILAVLVVHRRPGVATALLTVAAWVKVWPAAIVVAMVVVCRAWRRVLVAGAAVSAAVLAAAMAAGASANPLSFIGFQATRGVQVESPAALPFLWTIAGGDRTRDVYLDQTVLAYQVRGPGVEVMGALFDSALPAAVAIVLGLAFLARRRTADPMLLLAVTAFGLVAADIALNKVGSPQYLTWYAAPLVLGLLADPRRFRLPAVLTGVAAALTQITYPWFLVPVLQAQPALVAVLTCRALIEGALLVWALVALVRLVRGPVVLVRENPIRRVQRPEPDGSLLSPSMRLS